MCALAFQVLFLLDSCTWSWSVPRRRLCLPWNPRACPSSKVKCPPSWSPKYLAGKPSFASPAHHGFPTGSGSAPPSSPPVAWYCLGCLGSVPDPILPRTAVSGWPCLWQHSGVTRRQWCVMSSRCFLREHLTQWWCSKSAQRRGLKPALSPSLSVFKPP